MKSLLAGIPYGKLLIVLTAMVWIVCPPLRLMLPPDWAEFVFKEGGVLETIPVVLYLVVAVLFFAGPYHRPESKWLLGAVCLLFAARELDIDELVGNGNFLFFPEDFEANYPGLYLAIKAAGLALALILVGCSVYRYWPVVVANLRDRDPHQLMMIGGVAMIGISIVTDGFRTKVIDATGFDIGYAASDAITALEEGTEAMIPVWFLFALMHYYKATFWTSPGRQSVF